MRNMRSLGILGGMVLASVALSLVMAPGALGANNSEQVVYSGTGAGTFGGTGSAFGFWVWCEADSSNPYTSFCTGSVYIYSLGLVRGVKGSVSENPDHVYHAMVSSTDGAIACSLTNALPITSGPTNTVTADCTAPTGGGMSTNAVVVVTGPG